MLSNCGFRYIRLELCSGGAGAHRWWIAHGCLCVVLRHEERHSYRVQRNDKFQERELSNYRLPQGGFRRRSLIPSPGQVVRDYPQWEESRSQ